MKTKKTLFIFIATAFIAFNLKGQVTIDTISLVAIEDTSAKFCFNNTKLMAGNNTTDRYLVYYNTDTIFLNILQSGIWTRKIAHTGSNIKSATLTFYKDTIWICWKEGAFIKTRYTPDKGTSWSGAMPVSPAGNVAAPSIYASNNGKIHFVWSKESATDTTVYHRSYSNGGLSPLISPLSNPTGQGLWPSVIAIGDTILCAWKEGPLPTKVWYRSSFNGGTSWNTLSSLPTTTLLPISKDPNLAYAYDSIADLHYVYLAYDSQNIIYFQRSTDFGNNWTPPDTVSNPNKLSQFAHLECNNKGFVGIAYEQRPIGSSLYDDTKKDVGFTYSTAWGQSGSFVSDSLAYSYNPFGSAYPGFNKIDENNFYLVWLTKDTVLNKIKIFERRVFFNSTTGIANYNNTVKNNIIIFPNPTNGNININLSNQKIQSIKIYNLIGELLQEYFTTTFSIKNLPSGLYFITVQTNRKTHVNKLIKQ